jgi:16S rRNA (adenine1518-N6/adenine1519-N6)-dimethyltransferase
MASYFFDIEYILSVPKTSFVPVPKVDSALIRLLPKKQMVRAINEEMFANLVRIVFSERRKMIKNSLSKKFNKLLPGSKRFSKDEITTIIEQIPDRHKRPEELTLDDFVLLANKLDELLNH